MKVERLIPAGILTPGSGITVLGVDVDAFVEVRGGLIAGTSQILYKVDRHKNINTNVTINNEYVNKVKHTQTGFDVLEPAIRAQSVNLIPGEVEYDIRAFMYVLAKRIALLTVVGTIDVTRVERVIPVSSGGFVFDTGDIAYTPPPGGSALALTVFAQVYNECNVQRIFVVSDSPQMINDNLQSTTWLRGHTELAVQMFCDARREGQLGEAFVAFARGLSCVLKLFSHTDEGGYTRRAIFSADYPRPRGWFNAITDHNILTFFKHKVRVTLSDIYTDCCELLLQFAGLLHDSEPLARGTIDGDPFVTIIAPTNPEMHYAGAAPCDYKQLPGVLDTWRRHASIMMTRWQNSERDSSPCLTSGFELYCQSTQFDRHLAYRDDSGIIPFCWVEACGLSLSDKGCNIPGPGGVNAQRKLKYLTTQMTAPTCEQWEKLKRVMRYLNGTRNYGIKFNKGGGKSELTTYVDSSYGADKHKGRSITGYVTYLANGPIYWKSHMQSTVADSINTAEYIGLYEAAVSVIGTSNLLMEMGMDKHIPIIYEDNDGARRLATNGMRQKKARHLDIKHHYVQSLCESGDIRIERVPTDEQPADLLTKGGHSSKKIAYFKKKLGMVIYTQ